MAGDRQKRQYGRQRSSRRQNDGGPPGCRTPAAGFRRTVTAGLNKSEARHTLRDIEQGTRWFFLRYPGPLVREDVPLGARPTNQCVMKIFAPTMIKLDPASTTPDQSVPNVDLRAVSLSTRVPRNANRATMIKAAIS